MKYLELTDEWNNRCTIGRWICFQYYRGELRRGIDDNNLGWIIDIVEEVVGRRLAWLRLMNGEYLHRNFVYREKGLGPIITREMNSLDGTCELRRDEMVLYGIVGRRFCAGVAQLGNNP